MLVPPFSFRLCTTKGGYLEVDIGVAYGCDEFDFRGLEGVVVGDFDVEEPATSCE